MCEQPNNDIADALGIEPLGEVDIDDVAVDMDVFDTAPLEQTPGQHVGRVLETDRIISARVITMPHTGEWSVRLEPDHSRAGDGKLFSDTDGLTHE